MTDRRGSRGRTLRVDLTTRTASVESWDEAACRRLPGGRGYADGAAPVLG